MDNTVPTHRYRVGRHQPGNLYEIDSAGGEDRRMGFTVLDEDGPLVVAALNRDTWLTKAQIERACRYIHVNSEQPAPTTALLRAALEAAGVEVIHS